MRGHSSLPILVIALSVGLSATPAFAETYRWKTPDGVTHLGDAMPPDQANLGYEIIDPSTGGVLREIARKTPEQIKADEEAKSQAEQDRLLRSAYPTLDDIKQARDARLSALDQKIARAKAALEAVKKKGQDGSLEDAAQAIKDSLPLRRAIADLETRREDAEKTFADALRRYEAAQSSGDK